MRLDSRVVVLAAGLACACMQQEQATDRDTNVSDSEVQALFAVAAQNWDAAAFSPLPTTGSIRLFKKGPATAPDANDAGLLAERESGSRNWFFNRATGGYRLVCAAETVRGTRVWQRGEVNAGRAYQERLDINFVADDPGVCGTGLKPGLHATYWGPNGIEEVDRDAVVRLRAQFQQ